MFKRILRALKGKQKQPPAATPPEQDTLPVTPPGAVNKSATKTKPDLWSWGLLTGTYNPLPEDIEANDDADNATQPQHKTCAHEDNKS